MMTDRWALPTLGDPVVPRLAKLVEGFVLQQGSNNGGVDEPAESFESVTIPLDP
jgi:hypothetical protein